MLGMSSLGAVTANYRASAEKVLTKPAKQVMVLSSSGGEQGTACVDGGREPALIFLLRISTWPSGATCPLCKISLGLCLPFLPSGGTQGPALALSVILHLVRLPQRLNKC